MGIGNGDLSDPALVHAAVLIARVGRLVRQRLEQALAPMGLRSRELVALSYLNGHGPTAQRTLADSLCMDASSTVGLLNDLENSGLIVRERDRNDRRRALVRLSTKGETVMRGVYGSLSALDAELLGELGVSERAAFRRLLARVDSQAQSLGCVSRA